MELEAVQGRWLKMIRDWKEGKETSKHGSLEGQCVSTGRPEPVSHQVFKYGTHTLRHQIAKQTQEIQNQVLVEQSVFSCPVLKGKK